MRRLTLTLVSILVLAALARAQSESPPAAESRPRNKAEEIAVKIEKQVEKLRGLEFKTPVKIGVYDKATLKAFLLKHAEKELTPARIEPHVRALKILNLIPEDMDFKKVLLDILNEQVAGFYDPDTKELRLIDRNAPDPSGTDHAPSGMEKMAKEAMARMGIDEDAVIMAHELTHALQDQFIGLKTLPMEIEDDDDLVTASQSVVEGDATMAMMAWTFVKMGQPSKMIFNKAIASSIDQLVDLSSIPGAEAVANAPAYMKEGLIFPYLGGMKFCLAICAKDKTFAGVDHALKAPPLSTEQVLHPEKYTGEAPDYPMSFTLPDLSGTLGMPSLTTNTVGELVTRILLAEKIPNENVTTAAEGWDGDRYALYGKPGIEALVWVSTWDTPGDADEFEAALKTWLAALNPGKTSEASDVTSARFARDGGTVDAIARKGSDVILLRHLAKEKVIPVLQRLFEETKKVERRKV